MQYLVLFGPFGIEIIVPSFDEAITGRGRSVRSV